MKTYRYKNFAYRFYNGRLYRLDMTTGLPFDGLRYVCEPCVFFGEDAREGCDDMGDLCVSTDSNWQDITEETKRNLGANQ